MCPLGLSLTSLSVSVSRSWLAARCPHTCLGFRTYLCLASHDLSSLLCVPCWCASFPHSALSSSARPIASTEEWKNNEVFVLHRPKPVWDPVATLAGIAGTQDRVDALLGLCDRRFSDVQPSLCTPSGDRGEEDSGNGLVTACWALLQLVPTSEAVLASLQEPTPEFFSMHLERPGSPLTAYIMQAVVAYLQPPLDPSQWLSAFAPSAWTQQFVR